MINSSVIHPTQRGNMNVCVMLFVLLIALAISATAQGTGTISGRLTVGEKPAGGFTVFVVQDSNSSRQNAPVARGVADSEGRYQLTGLAAGKYRVRASAPGYVVESGSEYNFIIGKAVDLRDGETVENIDLKLTRGAVITGKITAPDGKPLIGTRLTVKSLNARGEYANYFSYSAPFQMMQTDDRGVYRLYGLPAGKYLIGAGAEANRGVSTFDGGMNYPLTYYPNATNEAEAKLLELAAGETKRDIDIRLASAETEAAADGTFSLNNLVPGKYRLLALPPPDKPQAPLVFDAAARTKLRKQAASAGKEITLAACQHEQKLQINIGNP